MVVKSNEEPINNSNLKRLWILLNTKKGTVPLFRGMGISSSIVDMKINQIQGILSQELDTQIKLYIPGLKFKKLICEKINEKLIYTVEVIDNA